MTAADYPTPPLTVAQSAVFLAIVAHVNRYHVAPRIEYIARKTGLTPMQAATALAWLITHGWLDAEQQITEAQP